MSSMMNVFQKLINYLNEMDKDMQIKTSGSTKDNNTERIRSGQSYLYKLQGMESEVIEIRFDKKVWGSMLNLALTETMKRYPYFNTKLIEKNGDFFIVQNENPLIARKTEKLHNLGATNVGKHLIDITYNDKSVFVSFHHALCDGRGIKPFIETLIYYYCSYKYNNTERIDGIRYSDSKLLDGETADPFLQEYDYDKNKKFISLSRDAFHLPENKIVESKINYRYEMKIPHGIFMRVCKENNATPVILLSLLMNKAIADIFPNYEKPINANIATDVREALGFPNTFKNCVKSMILPYNAELSNLSLVEQATKYRELLNAQRDYDYCKREANSMLGLFDKLDTFTTYKQKQSIMAFFEGMTLDTYIVSYLGQIILGSNAKHIESIHLYNSGTTGLGINMISVGEYFILDFKQNFKDNRYVKAFKARLDQLGIDNTVSEVIEFSTPTDNLIKRE